MTRLEACLYLRLLPGIGPIRAHKLVTHFGSPEAVFSQSSVWETADGLGTVVHRALKSWGNFTERVHREMAFIERYNIQCLFYGTPDYPVPLSFCPDAPLVLFARGQVDFNLQKIISIVGTRKNTAYGKAFCQTFVQALASIRPVIVSGFAHGIDIIAHRAAMENGIQTVGCLAHGFDKIYPANHKQYIHDIEKHGGFVTDFMQEDAFDRNNFPRRNRIIAGLAHATVIIESAEKGGSMNTADLAHQYGREVFALPGRVSDQKSQGCHQLIIQNKAQLLTSPDQFIAAMGWNDSQNNASVQKQLFVELTEDEKVLYRLLKEKSKESLDTLAIESQFSISKSATLLMQLEMKGCVRPLPGKYFEWI